MAPEAIETQTIGPATVVSLGSDLDEANDAVLARLSSTLSDLLEKTHPPLIVLDMSRVRHCKPQVLALLVRQQAEFRKRHGCLVLAGPCQGIRDILRITRFDHILPLEDDAGAAAANITEHAAAMSPPPAARPPAE